MVHKYNNPCKDVIFDDDYKPLSCNGCKQWMNKGTAGLTRSQCFLALPRALLLSCPCAECILKIVCRELCKEMIQFIRTNCDWARGTTYNDAYFQRVSNFFKDNPKI